jgi:Lon-like ATP-dependent protease
MKVSEKALGILSNYARNGREAVNTMQIAAGLAITGERNYIKDEDIEWIVQSSQLTPRIERKISDVSKIGFVNGLAVYGPNSGALLEIEVTVIASKDKGSINITGIVEEESIGGSGKSIKRKSMARGSIENVVTVLRSMGVPADGFDIHVNFPGGVPIDGPSAGIAMATGIYSAIYKIPIDHQMAMTGEISIHGFVKPIGGVLPKVKAAVKAGAKKVIIPAENMQSILAEFEGIEIIPVNHLREVLEIALKKEETPDGLLPQLNFSKRESV